MDDGQDKVETTKRRLPFRKRTAVGLVAFVFLSAFVHLTLGTEVTNLSPHFAASDLPDSVSIVTLSRKEELQKMPPPPTPTPSPRLLPRTNRDLALLKYREMAKIANVRMSVRPPARRHVRIIIEHPVKPVSDERIAHVVAAAPVPTPEPTQTPGDSRTANGGTPDLSGNVVWGDDNPVRIIKTAQLGIDDHAPGTATVEVEVGADGQILSVRLVKSSGDPNVDDAAVAAARASTFAPATLNGLPVHGTCDLDFPPTASQQST